ncbi:MAG: NADH:flavin oxidoreductase [Actinomycetia bacterium]|nr:NADH:flavin oxidoreductase [Actinomycetes bacterium]
MSSAKSNEPPTTNRPAPGTWNTPVELGPLTLRNRVIKAATFEGRCEKNQVSDELIEFHREVSAGGVAMTTLAFCAVSRDARGAPGELVLSSQSAPGLSRLADAVHAEGALVAAQVGHAGAVAAGIGVKAASPSPVFSPLAMQRTRGLEETEIRSIIGDFAAGSRLLAEAGFDAIELHFGHGYLPSEFLSPKLNKRNDGWGGSIENRARFCREIAGAVRSAVGDEVAVTAKLNMDDGVRGGLWLDESVKVGRLLEDDGHLDALELTCGSSLQNPMYLFRGEVPLDEMSIAVPKMVRPGFRIAGGLFLKEYPFEEAYMLPMARQFREALSMPLILLGGINRADTIDRAVEDGFEMVAIGRALLRDPQLLRKFEAGEAEEGLCVHCNKCMPSIYTGTRCVLV